MRRGNEMPVMKASIDLVSVLSIIVQSIPREFPCPSMLLFLLFGLCLLHKLPASTSAADPLGRRLWGPRYLMKSASSLLEALIGGA